MPQGFAKDASLVLIGMRCAGKSSLASIAAKALHWKVVDEKWEFQKATGCSVGGFIQKHGVKAYCSREVSILESILEENQQRRIIICSSSCVETQAGRDLLRQYLSVVPIVHIMRDGEVLKTYLESKWNGNVTKILRSQEPVYLACSNLTFFNNDNASTHFEGPPACLFEAVSSPSDRPTSRSLSLKRVESDFLRFLSSVYGRTEHDTRSIAEDASVFNYALQLPFGNFKQLGVGVQLEALTCTADVLMIRTDALLRGYLAKGSETELWWQYVVDQLAFLRRRANQPILYHTVPLGEDLAMLKLDYFDLVELGLRTGVELVTMDLTQDENRLRTISQQKGRCKFIGWFHDTTPDITGGWTGQNRLAWYEKAVTIGCDIIHLTQPVIEPSDNALALSFARTMSAKGSLLVSAYNTGRRGRLSQCFNRVLTVVRHPDITEAQSETVTIPQAQAALFSSFSCEPLSFSVVGANVRYSLAPVLHNSAYEVYRMPHEYSITQADSLDSLDALIQDDHFGGIGLSAPYKTEVIPRLRCMSAEARAIGAVNTVMPIRHWNGESSSNQFSISEQRNQAGPVLGLYGDNNDWKAIKSCALRYLSPANAITPLSTALIVGAGGMARAAIYAMIRSGIKHLCIYNRTRQHAIDLICHFERLYADGTHGQHQTGPSTMKALETLDEPWPSTLRFPTIIINCSPIPGDSITLAPPTHQGSVGPKPAVSIPDAWLRSPTRGVYMEIAYNSLTSSPELLRICSEDEMGWIGVAGLEIFFEVATAQFEFWTGRRAPRHIMKAKLGQYLQQMQNDTIS